MAGSSSNNTASASIVCDPSNYDWVDDDTSRALFPGTTSPVSKRVDLNDENARTDLDTALEGPQISPPPKGNAWANTKPTDKDLFDCIYGESVNQTLMRLCNQFVPIVEEGADTLIYIGPPPKAKGQLDPDYEHVKRAFERPYLLKSDTLRKLGSSKFDELLGPKSKRTQRKLQKAGIHKLLLEPEKIKYFIDLTPDIHDDEGMVLLLELSAPPGARSWHKDAQRFNIQSSHVCGRDAFDMVPRPMYRPQSQDGPKDEDQDGAKPSNSKKNDTGKTKSGKQVANEDSDSSEDEQGHQENQTAKEKKDAPYNQPEEDDYSQLRHHTGIVRLLQAIAGHDPKLNSASKAWTFCMLAKFFDCAKNEIISGWVTDWVVQSGNLNFVQVNPSIAYRFGVAMGTVWLVRSSFCIMVGLKAFEHVKTFTDVAFMQSNTGLKVPPASRITDGLDDDDINRVDHAALALVKRVNAQLHALLTENGEWKNCLSAGSQMNKLYELDLADADAKQALREVKESLDHYVRRLLCAPLVEFDDTKGNKGNFFKPPLGITSYHIVPALLRPFTLQFWEAMRSQDIVMEPVFSTFLGHSNRWQRTLTSLREDGALTAENANIPFVTKPYLNLAIDLLNGLLCDSEANTWPTSPKKKVKFSPPPPSKHVRQPIPVTLRDEPVYQSNAKTAKIEENYKRLQKDIFDHVNERRRSTETFEPAQPATFLGSLPIRNVDGRREMTTSTGHPARAEQAVYAGPTTTHDVEAQEPAPFLEQFRRRFSFEYVKPQVEDGSDTDDDDDGDNEWEDVMDELEAQTKEHPAKPVTSVGGLSIRSKPIESQISTDHASGEFSQSDVRGKLPSTQSDSSQFDEKTDINLHRPIPEPRPVQYPSFIGYGNPGMRPFELPAEAVFSNALTDHLKDVLDKGHVSESTRHNARQEALYVINPDDDETVFNTKVNSGRYPRVPNFEPEDVPIFADHLLNQIGGHVRDISTSILLPGFMADNCCAYDIPLHEVGTLTCLSDEEYKYLPLWAGGNDDGSGGVFDDGEDIPEAPEVEFGGFRGGAMGIIPGVGSTIGGSVAGSEFEEISTEVGISTVGKASRIATDGADTVMSLDD